MRIYYQQILPIEPLFPPPENISEPEVYIPDITKDLACEDSFYLVKQRIDNLREKIGKTFDEIVELQELEREYQVSLNDTEAIPGNLGIPSKNDQLVAALEAKRTPLYKELYDGGEIDEDDEYFSDIDEYYMNLLEDCWLNKKSFRFMDAHRNLFFRGQHEVSVFDVFDKSSIGEVFMRCSHITKSPIFLGMREIAEDHYALQNNIQMKFKDKSVKFLIPMREFRDICKPSPLSQILQFIEFSFTLPGYAHEKKRFFKKEGANIEEFLVYLSKLGITLDQQWSTFFHKIHEEGMIRFYREVLNFKDSQKIRGYFFNIVRGYTKYSEKHKRDIFYPKEYLNHRIQAHLKRQSGQVHIIDVNHFKVRYNEWMRKIGGTIVEHRKGKYISFRKKYETKSI